MERTWNIELDGYAHKVEMVIRRNFVGPHKLFLYFDHDLIHTSNLLVYAGTFHQFEKQGHALEVKWDGVGVFGAPILCVDGQKVETSGDRGASPSAVEPTPPPVAAQAPVAFTLQEDSVTTSDWEYQEFVWTPSSQRWVLVGPYNQLSASQMWWQEDRNAILSQLQTWLEQGWEPIGNIGPECYQLREYTKPKISNVSAAGCLVVAIYTITTFGLFLLYVLIAQDNFIEPIRFRIPMRRRRR